MRLNLGLIKGVLYEIHDASQCNEHVKLVPFKGRSLKKSSEALNDDRDLHYQPSLRYYVKKLHTQLPQMRLDFRELP